MEVNRIYNQDCLEFLASIPSDTIDLVVTSPPYNKNAYASASGDTKSWSGLRGRQIAYDTYSDDMPPCEYENWQRKLISECLRVLKPSGSIFYNHKDILVGGLTISQKFIYDFPLHQQIIWDRKSSLANDPHYFQPITEYIYWLVKDAKKFFFDKSKSAYRNNIWTVDFAEKGYNNPHPAPFPLKLIRSIIASACPEEGLVFDPFMGSGTTAVATIQVGGGRKFIGTEISPTYCDYANNRIEIAQQDSLTLF